LLALSGLATATSLLVYALTPAWWLMVALGTLAGLGAGAIDAGLNTYVATHHSARTLNWLHAAFGLGATTGPLVMTMVLQNDLVWRWSYVIVGTAQLALAACFVATRAWWETPGAPQAAATAPSAPAASIRSTLQLSPVWLGILVFFLYTGIEVAAGQWSFTLFTTSRAVAPAVAGVWISMYWGGLMVGRIIFGAVVNAAPLRTLLRWSLGSIVLGAVLVWINVTLLNVVGLVLMGLALAPVFPSLISTTPQRLGEAHAANGVGFQIAAAGLGAALIPAAVGVLAAQLSIEVVGPVLVVASAALFTLYEVLERRTASR
jgi:fucose permease